MDENHKKLFLELYQMILSDTEVHPKELEMLYQIGKEKGVSKDEIQNAIFSPNSLFSSHSLNNDEKINYLYNLARMAWADEKLDETEKETLRNTCKRFGFAEEYIVEISEFLFEQAQNRKTIEEVLETIKKL
ncbi:DnaJ-like protein DjlA [termite gut metagenome]|uniref:DnaJ-like protein DjlA n=1 Tax=termite gut metagenome TaxID=433724 RepID=A0A5J4PS54_9ZZZZ